MKRSIEAAVLTPREVTVLQLIGNGLRSKEIAIELGVAEHTVKVHLKNIFAKLGVNDRTEAFCVALRMGIVDLK